MMGKLNRWFFVVVVVVVVENYDLAAISLNPALKEDENYYPQVFLQECNYIQKKQIRHFFLHFFFLPMGLMKNKFE